MVAEAIKKIEGSIEGLDNHNMPADPIVKHLISKLEHDEGLAALVTQEHKTLQKCFVYVSEQVRKELNGEYGWLDDDVVYLMAIDYFLADDADLERKKAEEKAEAEERNRKLQEERRKTLAAAAQEKERQRMLTNAQKAAAKKQSEGQLSLFGEDEDDAEGLEEQEDDAA